MMEYFSKHEAYLKSKISLLSDMFPCVEAEYCIVEALYSNKINNVVIYIAYRQMSPLATLENLTPVLSHICSSSSKYQQCH